MSRQRGMVCYHCGMKIFATIEQAKKHGWEVWVGGAQCKRCIDGDVAAVDARKVKP